MKYSRICAALLLSASSLVVAEPTVTGKVISWADDGWYQVQVVTDSGISEVCAGTRFCEVEPGTYIVINHTTGKRFEGVVINADLAAEVLTIEDNTITWPDDGWYQVQSVTDNGITEVCAGTRFCEVPNGTYIVINHTTGMRYEDIVVHGESSQSEVTVSEGLILWSDNGWYQVQAVTEDGIVEVCAGTRFCEVPSGTYIVINHTTGERFEPVVVSVGPVLPDPEEPPVIRADSWEEILRNIVALINADRAFERREMLEDRFGSLSRLAISETLNGDSSGTLASLGLTLLPLADPANNLEVDYSCNAGGRISFSLTPGVRIYGVESDNCAIGGDIYDGGLNYFGVGREGESTRMDNLSATLADSTAYLLSGAYRTSFDRVDVRRSAQWTDATMKEQSGSDNYSVESFSMWSESASGPDFSFPFDRRPVLHSATVDGGFSVTADWTGNQPLQVTVDLMLGGSYEADELDQIVFPSQWTSGSIEVIAADGSRLSLSPNAGDTSTAIVSVSGTDEVQQVRWNDGYQVHCFAEPSEFPDCQ